MWRDILIILAFIVATLTYLNLTPRRLSRYAKTAKAEVGKRPFYQSIFLLLGIIVSLSFVSVVIYTYARERFELTTLLFGIALLTMMWESILVDVWKISERLQRRLYIVAASVALPSFIAAIILSDMLLWQKLAYPIGGFCIGYGINALQRYIGRKLRRKHSSNEQDK